MALPGFSRRLRLPCLPPGVGARALSRTIARMVHEQEPIKAALASAQSGGDLDILSRPVIAERYRVALERTAPVVAGRRRGERRLIVAATVPVVARRQISDLPWPVWLFIVSMIVPSQIHFEIEGMRIGPQRIVLLAAAGGVAHWLYATGRLRLHDVLIIGAGLWAAMASFTHLPRGRRDRERWCVLPGRRRLRTSCRRRVWSACCTSGWPCGPLCQWSASCHWWRGSKPSRMCISWQRPAPI